MTFWAVITKIRIITTKATNLFYLFFNEYSNAEVGANSCT